MTIGTANPAVMAVVRAALTRGYLQQDQLRQALLLQDQLRSAGRNADLLPILRSRFLPPGSLPELTKVYRQAAAEAGQAARPSDVNTLPPPAQHVPPDLLQRSSEMMSRPPEQDPAAVREFMSHSGAYKAAAGPATGWNTHADLVQPPPRPAGSDHQPTMQMTPQELSELTSRRGQGSWAGSGPNRPQTASLPPGGRAMGTAGWSPPEAPTRGPGPIHPPGSPIGTPVESGGQAPWPSSGSSASDPDWAMPPAAKAPPPPSWHTPPESSNYAQRRSSSARRRRVSNSRTRSQASAIGGLPPGSLLVAGGAAIAIALVGGALWITRPVEPSPVAAASPEASPSPTVSEAPPASPEASPSASPRSYGSGGGSTSGGRSYGADADDDSPPAGGRSYGSSGGNTGSTYGGGNTGGSTYGGGNTGGSTYGGNTGGSTYGGGNTGGSTYGGNTGGSTYGGGNGGRAGGGYGAGGGGRRPAGQGQQIQLSLPVDGGVDAATLPEPAQAPYARLHEKVEQGQQAAALEEADAAVAAAPDHAGLLVERAILRLMTQDARGAAEDVQRAVELDPKSGHAYYVQGILLMHTNRMQDALKVIRQATQLAPDFEACHHGLAVLGLGATGDAKGVLQFLEQTMQRHPEWVSLLSISLQLRQATQDQAGMRRDIERAAEAGVPTGIMLRAQLRAETGDRAGAKADIETLLELAPDHPQADQWRQALKQLGG